MVVAQTAAGYALTAVLGVAALGKCRSIGIFRQQIADYRVLPYRLTGVAAVAVIAGELAAGAMLATRPMHALGGVLAAVLLGFFTAAQLSTFARGRNVSCGCFGGRGDLDRVGPTSIVRTCALLGLAIATAATDARPSVAALAIAALLIVAIFLIAETTRLLGELSVHRRQLVAATSGDVSPGKG